MATLFRRTLLHSPKQPLILLYPKRNLNIPSQLHDLKIIPTMHARATVAGTTIAETDSYEYVEGNVYFPISSVVNQNETLTNSTRTSQCPWKGEGHYYDVNVNGQTVADAAWYYPSPFPMAKKIKDHVAFGWSPD
jgi:uncharacterized protein (DUF427 family)